MGLIRITNSFCSFFVVIAGIVVIIIILMAAFCISTSSLITCTRKCNFVLHRTQAVLALRHPSLSTYTLNSYEFGLKYTLKLINSEELR